MGGPALTPRRKGQSPSQEWEGHVCQYFSFKKYNHEPSHPPFGVGSGLTLPLLLGHAWLSPSGSGLTSIRPGPPLQDRVPFLLAGPLAFSSFGSGPGQPRPEGPTLTPKRKANPTPRRKGQPQPKGPSPTRRANPNPEKHEPTPTQEKEGPTPNPREGRANPNPNCRPQPRGPIPVLFSSTLGDNYHCVIVI